MSSAGSVADPTNVVKVSSLVEFDALTKLLEAISKIDDAPARGRPIGKNEEKKQLLQHFMSVWRTCGGNSGKKAADANFFPAMRLLLPHADRRVYGLKETKLANYLIEALAISADSADGKRLRNYRAPSSSKNAGDFASTAWLVLQTRCLGSSSSSKKLSIDEINHHLDIISANNTREGQRELKASLTHLLVNMSAVQLKWLIRILLKDLKIGIKEHVVLEAFHQDAMDLFNCTSSLEKVCEHLADPAKRSHEAVVSLFTPCKPMLGEKAKPNEIERLMHGQAFYIETKFDGERFQIHKSGDQYAFYSRNGHDYTEAFGADQFSAGSLTPYIHAAFDASVVKNLILDGEMCDFNTCGNIIMSKGSEKEFGNVKSHRAQLDSGEGEIHPCFCAFDVLLFNDTVLTNRPLRERLDVLGRSFKEINGRIMFSERKEASTNQQVVDRLNDAIDARQEGIVIKNPDSVYKPSVRSGGGWFKVKPDYINGLNDDLDLIIVGGYYGRGNRSGLLSHFLLAVAYDEPGEEKRSAKMELEEDHLDLDGEEKSDAKEQAAAPPAEPQVFYTFCKIGSGYTLKELAELNAKLANKWLKFESNKPPKHLKYTVEKPDVWIEPKDSFVVQVKAVEICASDRYKTGCSLRFPRLERFRPDKAWHECMKLSELTELRDKNEGKLTSGAHYDLDDFNFGDDDGGEPSIKRKKMSRATKKLSVDTRFRGIDPSLVDKDEKNAIFAEKEFCVVTGNDKMSKADLETLIVKYGGTFVQNPCSNTFCILTSKMLHKLDPYVAKNLYDIVKIDWLLRCISDRQLQPFRRTDMFYTTTKTEHYMKDYYDKYGDSYTEDLTVETLRGLFESMSDHPPTPSKSANKRSLREKIAFLENKYFPDESHQYGLFRMVNAYLDIYAELGNERSRIANSPLDLTEIRLRAYGAQVTTHISEDTSHCIVDDEDLSRLDELKRINRKRPEGRKLHIVSSKWVKQSIEATRLLIELPYHL